MVKGINVKSTGANKKHRGVEAIVGGRNVKNVLALKTMKGAKKGNSMRTKGC